ncbi:MAG: hypothetical protein JOZ58_28475 [Acetobacteraceae bacterium]|nr:hypothetical protein [Acetobacteraceae bacterium]MBV8578958.1 hypothetical protein [Acetobacteraceae bacterium]
MEPLRFGPLTDRTVHLCVDMQNLFALDTPWHTPWMARVLPVVTRIAEHHPAQTDGVDAPSRHLSAKMVVVEDHQAGAIHGRG